MSGAIWCPQCGPETGIDEDGCCSTCGCDAVGDGADQAVAALAEVKRLERSLDEERDNRSISVLIASVVWAENRITQLERSMEWFADPYNYHTGDIPTNRESDLIREHTARARKAQVDDVRNRAVFGVGLRGKPGE